MAGRTREKVMWKPYFRVLKLFLLAAFLSSTSFGAKGAVRLELAPAAEQPRAPLAVDGPEAMVDLPDVRERLRDIAAKLLSHSDPSSAAIRPDIFITTDSSGAMATESGDIFIGIGLLQDVFRNEQSDDVIAFVLAHELAHLQHDHLGNERTANDLDNAVRRFLGLLGAAQELVAEIKSAGLALSADDTESLDQGISALIASVKALQAVQTGILMHAFNREQELEADEVALETMWRAKYSPDQSLEILQDLKKQRQAVYVQTADAIRSAANAAKVIFKIGKKYQEGIGSGILPFDPTDLIFDLAGEGMVATFCEFAESHPTIEKRIEKIETILKETLKYKSLATKIDFVDYLGTPESGLPAKYAELEAARAVENSLEVALVKRNPLRTKEGCGAEDGKSAGEKLGKKVGDAIGGFFSTIIPSDLVDSKPVEHQPTVDISGELSGLGKQALAAIKDRKGQNYALGWTAFARVRAEQERFSDALENFKIARRGNEAAARVDRLLALTQAKMGAHDKAAETLSAIEMRYGAEWVPDLALELAIRARSVKRILPALLSCGRNPHFYVKERCLTTALEFRPELQALGVDPDAAIKIGDDSDEPFWKKFL